ncbi:MAG TPA: roadblock/LC7 domain-containing protein [Candidatus Sulfotelmatobacter sp.]|nr:roadblock/LC7 domain-containing protein [Candidatus Sulfotelmatobacter sp.]
MKLKFAGFFRSLLRHAEDSSPARQVAPPTPPPAATPPPETPTEFQRRAAAAAARNTGADATEIFIPLTSVVTHLPMDLKSKLMSSPQPGQMIALAVETVLQQLAFGSVKISFGELRRLAPGMFANSGGEHDSRQIILPLPEILSRLNPALLSRKPVQKVDVTGDISGPFDGRGRGLTFTTQPLKPSAASPSVTDLRAQNNPVPFTPPPIIPKPSPLPPRVIAPAPTSDTEVFTFKPRQVVPPAAPAAPITPVAPVFPQPPQNKNGQGNGNGHPIGHSNGNSALPPFKFSTAPAAPTPANSSAPRPQPAQSVLHITLDDLAENWPQELKDEIMAGGFSNVPLNSAFVDAGLKRGRVTMTWKEVRALARPGSPASPFDDLPLELPLKVLAPAFMAAQKNGFTKRKVQVAEEIPNLFFGFPNGNSDPAAQTIDPPAAAPIAPAALAVQKVADTNFFTAADKQDAPVLRMAAAPQTDFINRQAHPQEVVSRALALPGVTGAVVALADGLRVASNVPAELNADAIAAFLPQIFERVNQSTRELRMGALNNVGFTIGNVPWKIFRVNSIYFAAFGRAGESLPKAQLVGLAAELDRKKQF